MGKRFCNKISEDSPSWLGQNGSCSKAQRPVELSENILPDLTPLIVNSVHLGDPIHTINLRVNETDDSDETSLSIVPHMAN